MKFCSECAHPVSLSIPEGDNRPRYVCANCDAIHYQNPKMVVGSIPVWEEDGQLQVLLCKRAIEPRLGYWTLPAGFMENDETTSDAAERETVEEAGANIELGSLFSLLNVQRVHQVGFKAFQERQVILFKKGDGSWTMPMTQVGGNATKTRNHFSHWLNPWDRVRP